MIKVINYTENPLQAIGYAGAICYDSIDIETILNKEKSGYAKAIAKHCLSSGHTRTAEFADVTLLIDGYSARVIRELYTHIIGTSRTQASTRYIKYVDNKFGYYTPVSIKNNLNAQKIYDETMAEISKSYNKLLELGIKQQDVANILPLGHNSSMTLKINVRALMHLYSVRTCQRAYEEFRMFMRELSSVLCELDEEWKYLHDNYFKTKCKITGYCDEGDSCGAYPTKKELTELLNNK